MRNWIFDFSHPASHLPLSLQTLLYPVSFPPPPLQFHNLTLNGVRGAGAGEGAEVVEENFKAPSAVKKKPIPSPSYFVFFFFFFKGSGWLGLPLSPPPPPAPGPDSPGVAELQDQGRDHGGDA